MATTEEELAADAAELEESPDGPAEDEAPIGPVDEQPPERITGGFRIMLPDGRVIRPSEFGFEVRGLSGSLVSSGVPDPGQEVKGTFAGKVKSWDYEDGTITVIVKANKGSLYAVPIVDQLDLLNQVAKPPDPVDVDATLREHVVTCSSCVADTWGGLLGEPCDDYRELEAKLRQASLDQAVAAEVDPGGDEKDEDEESEEPSDSDESSDESDDADPAAD